MSWLKWILPRQPTRSKWSWRNPWFFVSSNVPSPWRSRIHSWRIKVIPGQRLWPPAFVAFRSGPRHCHRPPAMQGNGGFLQARWRDRNVGRRGGRTHYLTNFRFCRAAQVETLQIHSENIGKPFIKSLCYVLSVYRISLLFQIFDPDFLILLILLIPTSGP